MTWRLESALDRLDPLRLDEAALDELASSAESCCLHLDSANRLPIADGALRATAFDGPRTQDDLLLGRLAGRIWWVRRAATSGHDLRDVTLSEDDVQVAMAALALAEWHETYPVCLRCGAPTRPERAGASRRCIECGTQVFPRIDPAVIVAVTDHDDRLLLTHSPHWPGNRVSVQAGFVEAGESAEQAVYREVKEETGLAVEELSFVSSQPWPFPRSLMLGFTARADAAALKLDPNELAWGAFYTRDEMRAAVADGRLSLPGPVSLAIALIRGWLGSER